MAKSKYDKPRYEKLITPVVIASVGIGITIMFNINLYETREWRKSIEAIVLNGFTG